ncbi:UDP-glucose--hexose-1-phosphate uridylyltransferase [Trichococcus paludicola]|uniref:UDP-glucose--hexose-1-phosphate uridylyltransferase n=1 Tax=Trichococcus paludicola TaxID=2052942 RepID=UPI000D3B711F|nr:UDP-glucose--hexose-1-phosphate uridylyltransferase [Trichococcus paludicola]
MQDNSIDQVIRDFVSKGIAAHRIHSLDERYAINHLLGLLGIDAYDVQKIPSIPLPNLLDSLDRMIGYAVESQLISDAPDEIEIMEAQIMELITPLPSEVNKRFWMHYEEAPMRATDEFYRLSQDNDYIKTRKIAKNKHFSADSKYGKLEITINLSKPEKTRQQMEFARQTEGGNYPVCALCMENEGYRGRADAAARSNHRIVRLPLFGENWGFQYSPYSYYNEHCIILSEEHVPMHVTEETIANLLEIVTVFPHYFIGSNAGLPIVGGSILSHEHYQGGRHHFPMEAAQVLRNLALDDFPEVEAEILFWPLSVIRLRSEERDGVAAAACAIMEAWQSYSDPQADILAESSGMRHNAVTLIARRVDEAYELDVVLRNNRTTEAFPDGIFHPHPDVQHIKKENIGLIEVLGLAILPPRLETELSEVSDYLLGKTDDVAPCHREWAEELKQQGPFEAESILEIIHEAVGEKFVRVIEDAGVYKQTPEGQAGFDRFLSILENNNENT